MTKKCPYCGEHLPDNSLNCPRCFRSIPRDDMKQKAWEGVPDDRAPAVKTYNKYIVLILALIPSLFGIMGMAQIYQGYVKKGLKFLAVGLPLFLIVILCFYALLNGGLVAFLGVGALLIFGAAFVITYIVQALDAYARTIVGLRF